MELTEREIEVLRELVPSCSDEAPRWMRPMDVGGSNGSHHSATLAKLVRKGLAEDTGRSVNMERGSKRYRATVAGIEVDAALNGKRRTRAELEAHFEALMAAARARKAARAA